MRKRANEGWEGAETTHVVLEGELQTKGVEWEDLFKTRDHCDTENCRT